MGSKPIKQILEELEENLEKTFGDDTKLWSLNKKHGACLNDMRHFFCAYNPILTQVITYDLNKWHHCVPPVLERWNWGRREEGTHNPWTAFLGGEDTWLPNLAILWLQRITDFGSFRDA